jgi:CubicO group peptidase (beta-lactamase class C family)
MVLRPGVRKMIRRSLLVGAGALALGGSARARTPSAACRFKLASDLDSAIARAMAMNASPGLAVAVYSRDGVYASGFGVTDIDTGERATADTAFYVASSTKSLTALALSILHQRGDFNLDETLAAYAPDAPFPEAVRPREVRFRDLLSHTGGIENVPIGYRVAFTGQHDPETLWRLLAASKPNLQAPLGHFKYTNIGYNIATVLTDRRLGRRWQDLLHREIFKPAGMTRTTAVMSRAKAAHWSIAKPHGLSSSGRVERIYLEKTDQTMQSAGGVIMSANDAVRWLEFLVEGGRIAGRQVVSATALQPTMTPLAQVGARFAEYAREQYGLGWYVGSYRGERMLHDFGSFAGFRAHVSFLPDRGIGVAAFVNDETVAFPLVDVLANYIYDSTGGREDAATRFEAGLASVNLNRNMLQEQAASRAAHPWLLSRPRAAYAGVFESKEMGRLEVAVEGDAIQVRFGILHALAEPFTLPESLRVELAPGSGSVLAFDREGAIPDSILLDGQRFVRAKA